MESKCEPRNYIGSSGKSFLRIVFNEDCFQVWISYRNVKLTWKFNNGGRINTLDAITLHDKKVITLLEIISFEGDSISWNRGKARYSDLPSQVLSINRDISGFSFERKYHSLLLYGHSSLKNLVGNLNDGENIKDSRYLEPRHKQLKEIVSDPNYDAVKNASGLFPFVSFKDNEFLEVRYEQNKRES